MFKKADWVFQHKMKTNDQRVKEDTSLPKCPSSFTFTNKNTLTFFFCMYFRISKVCLISGIWPFSLWIRKGVNLVFCSKNKHQDTVLQALHFLFLNYILLFMLLQLSQFPLCPPPLSPTRQSLHSCPFPWFMHICPLANPFTFFQPAPAPPLADVRLFHVSVPLILFCSLVYFVH